MRNGSSPAGSNDGEEVYRRARYMQNAREVIVDVEVHVGGDKFKVGAAVAISRGNKNSTPGIIKTRESSFTLCTSRTYH